MALQNILGSLVSSTKTATTYNHKFVDYAVIKVYNVTGILFKTEQEFYETVKPSCYIPKFYCSGPNFLVVEKFIANFKDISKRLSLDQKLVVLVDVVLSMEYVHQNSYIHNYIRFDNIFVRSDASAVLANFEQVYKLGELTYNRQVTKYDRRVDISDLVYVVFMSLTNKSTITTQQMDDIDILIDTPCKFAIERLRQWYPNPKVAKIMKELFTTLQRNQDYMYDTADYTKLIEVLVANFTT